MEPVIQRGFIPIDLDKRRVLVFDHAATWLLIQKYGPRFLPQLYQVKEGKLFELVSMEALAFFLWAGLQRDAKSNGEELTLEQVQEFLRPWTYVSVFERVILAVVGATATPAMLGKTAADGEAATPAAGTKAAPAHPGPTKVTTLTTRSASRTSSSGGRRKSSGPRRR